LQNPDTTYGSSGSRAAVAALVTRCRVLLRERTCRRLRRMSQMGHIQTSHKTTTPCIHPSGERSSYGHFGLSPPSPPADKPTAREDQAGQASAGDRAGDAAKSAGIALTHRFSRKRQFSADEMRIRSARPPPAPSSPAHPARHFSYSATLPVVTGRRFPRVVALQPRLRRQALHAQVGIANAARHDLFFRSAFPAIESYAGALS
jgi:hypothetical protein